MSRLIVVVLLALTSLVLPSVAHADRWVGEEAVADARAWQVDPDDFCGGTEVTSDTAAAQDITSMVVRHQPRRLVVRLRYAAAADLSGRMASLHIRTPRRDLVVDLRERSAGGRWLLDVGPEMTWHPGSIDTDGDGIDDCEVWSAEGAFWRCPGHEIGVEPRSLVVSVPRSCLRDPAWVRVGAETWADAGDLVLHDTWGTSEPSFDPNVRTYGERVAVSPGQGQSAAPSNRSRVTNSETSWRRSFVISRTGLPSGTTAATAY